MVPAETLIFNPANQYARQNHFDQGFFDAAFPPNDDIDRLVDLKREMTGLIERIADPSYRVLLELRYLGCSRWEDIAFKMGYDLRPGAERDGASDRTSKLDDAIALGKNR
jgi:hypothetical protein